MQRESSPTPNYARAYATLAVTYSIAWSNPMDADHLDLTAFDQAYRFPAVRLDRNLP
jgi:hypothetical protein